MTLRSPLSPCSTALLSGAPPRKLPIPHPSLGQRTPKARPTRTSERLHSSTPIPQPPAAFSALDLNLRPFLELLLAGGSLLFARRDQISESVAGRSGIRGWVLPGYKLRPESRAPSVRSPPASQADGRPLWAQARRRDAYLGRVEPRDRVS